MRKNKKALIIDDNHAILETLSRIIESIGHESVPTENLEEADYWLKNGINEFGYLFVDIAIPSPEDYFTEEESKELSYSYSRNKNGLLWLRRKINEYPQIREKDIKVAILTANLVYTKIDEFEALGIPCFDKSDSCSVQNIIRFITGNQENNMWQEGYRSVLC